ncbi:U6 snRNA-associated Sm-like protein LSm6 [Phyllostomus hastatus]|uniref:U6 snRNA-associated Sm-like protein LSm6 n=1 Tax=Phyllostomus hastatus TaxID=9423 RepID=UPI001E680F0C|nr:U6 snRNA-associated Sm-like protein LSm6 [Phyllostomus hastatus]
MSLWKQTPSDLMQIIGLPIVVALNSGVGSQGVLACLHSYMNILIILERREEYVNEQLKNKYGDAFIQGNNMFHIVHRRKGCEDTTKEQFIHEKSFHINLTKEEP